MEQELGCAIEPADAPGGGVNAGRHVLGTGCEVSGHRVPPLKGARNFRDLGGYQGAGGRDVRWGRLFRSGSLGGLTVEDYGYLERLGVGAVYDLRGSQERAADPTVWQGQTKPRSHSRDYDLQVDHLVETLNQSPSPAELRASIIRSYGRMAYTHSAMYRQVFHDLANTDQPVIFHCAAGKDRTGVIAALLLTALGVSRSVIVSDYGLSDKLVNFEHMGGNGLRAAGYGALQQLSPELRAPLFASDPAYIEAALTSIELEEGSIASYLEKRLDVTSSVIERLRARLLEATK